MIRIEGEIMEYQRIFKDGSNLFVGKLGTVMIGIFNLMLLTRVLTTEEMGRYSLFLMVINLAITFGLTWSDASIIRHGREEFVKHGKIHQSFWARFYLFLPLFIMFILLFAIFRQQIANYIGVEPKLIIFIISLFIFNGLLNSIAYMYQSIDKMKKAAYVLFSQKLIYMIGLLALFFNIFNYKLSSILIILNVSFMISLIINIMGFDFKKIMPYKFNKSYLQKVWSYSWPQLFGFSGLYIINYVDLYVIRKYLSLEDVGIYSVAYNSFTMVCGMILIINTLFLPLIVEYRAKNRFDLIRKYIKKTPLFLTCWAGLVILGILLSKYVIPLVFSAKYAASVPSFNILLLTTVFYFISIYFLPIVNAFDLIIFSQIFNLIKSTVNIISDFALVPIFGVIGAAYGTLIAYLFGLSLTLILIFIKRKMIIGEPHD